jgi:hypothetical protein
VLKVGVVALADNDFHRQLYIEDTRGVPYNKYMDYSMPPILPVSSYRIFPGIGWETHSP